MGLKPNLAESTVNKALAKRNDGMLRPASPKICPTASRAESGFDAESIPNGMPISSAKMIDNTANSMVTGSASTVRLATLTCDRDENPRLPVAMFPSQEKN